ncbi:hypothetical protein LWI28_026696 [Acer negundo]|uniref:Reverse transcriptase Ty1/copia-type domain-containing protein n=1 Tax=Acer negundo TaxID=4023 RepID=A0AAD5IP23_ACENE|nr:hypothetical protein LWI28_026696 [Acer negundo]
MESSNVVIDDYRLKTIDHEKVVVVVDDSSLEKGVETSIDRMSNLNEEDTQPLDRVPLLNSNEALHGNKFDEDGNIVRNKTSFVAQGYSQIKGIHFEETFAPVAHLEFIRLLLSISCVHKFKLHQMDVKSAFLNGFLQEKVSVEQPKGFVDAQHLNHVYRLKKALYGLKQAPGTWYEHIT